jgi:hypothetical protein
VIKSSSSGVDSHEFRTNGSHTNVARLSQVWANTAAVRFSWHPRELIVPHCFFVLNSILHLSEGPLVQGRTCRCPLIRSSPQWDIPLRPACSRYCMSLARPRRACSACALRREGEVGHMILRRTWATIATVLGCPQGCFRAFVSWPSWFVRNVAAGGCPELVAFARLRVA